jgi:hypothetical protein
MKPLKERRCAVCRELYTPKRIGLKITKVCLNAACVLDWAQGVRAKEAEKAARVRKTEYYKGDLSKQLELCQKVFNKLRRLQELKWFADRGLEPTCISCGKPKGGDIFCAGHFKTRGAQSGLRFDPKNVYLQHNRRCNSDLSGDIYGTKTTHGYLQGLRNRFGDEEAKNIIDYCETNTEVKKWTCDELIAMRKDWNKQIRELENELK